MTEESKNICSVLIPNEGSSEIFDSLIRPLFDELNYHCRLLDIHGKPITKEMLDHLKNSFIVIADVSFFDPCVMWQLGVRNALSNRTILIADSQHYKKNILDLDKVFFYDDFLDKDFRKQIKTKIENIEVSPDKLDDHISEYLNKEQNDSNGVPLSIKRDILNKLYGLLLEFQKNVHLISISLNGDSLDPKVNPIFTTNALELYLSTRYTSFTSFEDSRFIEILLQSLTINKLFDKQIFHGLDSIETKRLVSLLQTQKVDLTNGIKSVNLARQQVEHEAYVYNIPNAIVFNESQKKHFD